MPSTRVALELAVHLPRPKRRGPDYAARWPIGGGVRPPTSSVDPRGASRIKRILVLREGEAATTRAITEVGARILGDLGAPIRGGSDCNFCELNREQALGRLAVEESDSLFWSINPQVHAVDSWSVMETIEAQGATVRTARAFADTGLSWYRP